jgi:hypothetical protein
VQQAANPVEREVDHLRVQALETRKQFGNSGFWGGHIRPFHRFVTVD